MNPDQSARFNEHLGPHVSRLRELGSLVREDGLFGSNIVRLYALDDKPIDPVRDEFISFLGLTLGSDKINRIEVGPDQRIVINNHHYTGLIIDGERIESGSDLMNSLLFGTWTMRNGRVAISGKGSSSYGVMASMYRVFCPEIDCSRREEMNDFLTQYKAEMIKYKF
ncbi:MAG: hypothetical protein WCV90_05290 [Candidatus Woesearchaeota archaeon]